MEQILNAAYAAGIMDGEGCIGIYRTIDKRPGRASAYYRVMVIVVQLHLPVIDFLKSTYGGSVDRVKRKKFKDEYGDYYRWCIFGTKCLDFLNTVRPFLRLKGEKADRAIVMQEHIIKYTNAFKSLKNGERSKAFEAILAEREKLYHAAATTKPRDPILIGEAIV